MKKLINGMLLCLMFNASYSAYANVDKDRDVSEYNLPEDGLAILGYDPVAYFPEGGGMPAEGLDEFVFDDQGVVYKFSSQENLDLFKGNPEKYAPTYGGWCATAMSMNLKFIINPLKFVINGNRLHLFSLLDGNDARAMWLGGNTARMERRADRNWQKISGEMPRD